MQKHNKFNEPSNIAHMSPSFQLDLEIIKTNILSKIHDDYFKNMTSTVLTRFSIDLAW